MAVLIRFILCLGFILLLPLSARAQQGEALSLYEQKIKAGLVYNFLKFTDWPAGVLAQNEGKLHVCLFGGDSFDGYLHPLEGKMAQQHVISIKRVNDIHQTDRCNLIFVHRNVEGNLPGLLKFLKGKPVLTMSDITDFASQGGMVEMTKENERVSLYINENEVGNSGVHIQNRILKLAKPKKG